MPSYEEVAKHNSPESCWVIIDGTVYDVTKFLPEHPGGQNIILRYAGKDASKKFFQIHGIDIISNLLPEACNLGKVTGTPLEEQTEQEEDNDDDDDDEEDEEERRAEFDNKKPPLSSIMNLFDFEHLAPEVMTNVGWNYYSSGADDEITMRENHRAFQRIWFRPRVLVDVTKVDPSTTFLGTPTSLPIYITATALGRLGHPDGEKNLTRAAAKQDVIQMIPTLASCTFDEIVDAAIDSQTQWLQLYVNVDRKIARKIVEHAEKRGIKGLFITVDAPQLGRREKDMKAKYVAEAANVQEDDEDGIDRSQGYARAISSFIDPGLSWKDIEWFMSITKMPIAIKGIQRVEDAVLAAQMGVHAIVLSNHGGRQLEFSKPAIEVLAETMPVLRDQGLDKKMEIYIDGGIRRGTDVLKAVALGAKGVGIGRPFLYAMAAYGDKGVVKAIQLLREEIEMNMRLLGVTSIDQLNPSFVDVRGLAYHNNAPDHLFSSVYEPMQPAKVKGKL